MNEIIRDCNQSS